MEIMEPKEADARLQGEEANPAFTPHQVADGDGHSQQGRSDTGVHLAFAGVSRVVS